MIVLDANILIRAVLGKRVGQLLEIYSGHGQVHSSCFWDPGTHKVRIAGDSPGKKPETGIAQEKLTLRDRSVLKDYVGVETRMPTHRDKAAMNGAQSFFGQWISRIDEWATCRDLQSYPFVRHDPKSSPWLSVGRKVQQEIVLPHAR